MAKLKIDIDKKEDNDLEKNFNTLYEHDSVLASLANFQETKKKLLGLEVDSNPWLEKRKELESLLTSHTLDSAFKSSQDYENYASSVLDSINTGNFETISKSLYPYLNDDYGQTLKATELFSESMQKAKKLGLAENSYYVDLLNDSMSQYDIDKLEASSRLLGLTSEINTDLFRTKTLNENTVEAISKMITGSYTDTKANIDSLAMSSMINAHDTEYLLNEKLDELSSISSSKEKALKDFIIEPKESVLDFSPSMRPELPRIEDSPIYKQNEKQIKLTKEISEYLILLNEKQEVNSNKQSEQNNKLLDSSFKQIELMASMSDFLASQSELLEAQRKNQESQNEHLKKQNNMMKNQIEDNKESSKRALIIAWAGIIIAVLTALSGVYVEYSISAEDDKLSIKNHEELKKVMTENSNKDLTEKLVEQLNIQNKYLKSIDDKLEKESKQK